MDGGWGCRPQEFRKSSGILWTACGKEGVFQERKGMQTEDPMDNRSDINTGGWDHPIGRECHVMSNAYCTYLLRDSTSRHICHGHMGSLLGCGARALSSHGKVHLLKALGNTVVGCSWNGMQKVLQACWRGEGYVVPVMGIEKRSVSGHKES